MFEIISKAIKEFFIWLGENIGGALMWLVARALTYPMLVIVFYFYFVEGKAPRTLEQYIKYALIAFAVVIVFSLFKVAIKRVKSPFLGAIPRMIYCSKFLFFIAGFLYIMFEYFAYEKIAEYFLVCGGLWALGVWFDALALHLFKIEWEGVR